MKINNIKTGFTLAEVLITLIIIGVIAALTVPVILQKTHEHETVSKVTKFFSTISSVQERIYNEYGSSSNWYPEPNQQIRTTETFNKIEKYLSVMKKCTEETDTGCFGNVDEETGNTYVTKITKNQDLGDAYGYGGAGYPAIVLNDGSSFIIDVGMSTDCTYNQGDPAIPSHNPQLEKVCFWVLYDTNGTKKPNAFGLDVFPFYWTDRAILPAGMYGDNTPNSEPCYLTGTSCTAWVIYKKNMIYTSQNITPTPAQWQ